MGTTTGKKAEMKKLCINHWPIFLIVIIWLIFSSPTWARGLVPFPSQYLVTAFAPWSTTHAMPVKSASMPDVITQIYPWKHISIDSWKQASPPFWNPYSFAGTLHAGNYQTAVFSPMNLLFLLLSQPVAWSLLILLQPLFAGFFMYLFLRSEDLSREATLIGSVAWMFCGFLVVWMAYGTLGYAAMMLPLCLFAVNKARKRVNWWALPILTFSAAFSLVSGHFQISIYVFLFTTLYICCVERGDGSHKFIYKALLFLMLGILMTAPQLLEAFHAYSESVRSSSFIKGEVIPWQYLITFFAPDFYGNPVTRNDWYGHYAEWAGFIGVLPLLMALIAVCFAKHKKKIFFAVSAVISLLFALPTPLMELMYGAHIPVLSTSSASRIILLSSFALSVLAAMGMDTIKEIWHKKNVRIAIRIGIFGFVYITVFWIILAGFHPFPPDALGIATRNSLLPTFLFISGLVIVIAGIYIPKKFVLIPVVLLILSCSFDSLRFAAKWMPFEPREYMYPHMPVIEKVAALSDIETARVIGNFGNEFSGMYGILGVEGYDAVYKKRYGELVSSLGNGKIGELSRSVVLMDKHGLYTEKFIQLMGVKYYMHKVSDGRFSWAYPFWKYPNFNVIWKDSTYEVFENSDAFPRAYLVSSYQKITDPSRIITTLFSDTFDRRDSVILEETPNVLPQVGKGEVTIESYAPQKILFRVHAQVAKLLFVSDAYDSGWRVYVNGKESKIYRADYALRAVGVPAGESIVVMKYEPYSLRVGAYISLAIILVIIGYIGHEKYYAHRFI